MIVYKETDNWCEWQGMTASDNEWQRVVQQVTTSGTTNDNKWQRVVQQVTASDHFG